MALVNDYITKDYTIALTTAKIKKSTLHKPLTTKEVRWLWQNVEKDVFKVILILYYTGMRQGELSGMKIENVHLKEKYMIGGSKTEAGIDRTIPIADCILPLVRHFYTISKFARFPFLIMPDKKRHLPKLYDKLCIGMLFRKNFSEHTAHDTRHGFITLCDNYSVPGSITKKIVGHASTNVTDDIYTHKSLQQMLKWVNTLPSGTEMYTSLEEIQCSHSVATQ